MIEYKIFKILTAAAPLVVEAELNELIQERWRIDFIEDGFIFLVREKEGISYDVGEDGPNWPDGPEIIKEGDTTPSK